MKALLFDLDGTLVDSIPLWIRASTETLEEFGCSMDADTFLKEIYHKGLHYEGILEHCGVSTENSAQFYQKRDDRFAALLEQGVEWIGNAENTLRECAAKLPLGMLTGSRHRFIKAMDTRLSMSSLFTSIITRDETGKRMKPDPYGLLLLAENIGVDPTDCMYIGDQYIDVLAAKAAGMTTCILPSKDTPSGAEEEADFVMKKIEDVMQIVHDNT